MNTEEVREYLEDNTSLTERQIEDYAPEIAQRLDYAQLHEQIDKLVEKFRYDDDYAKAARLG